VQGPEDIASWRDDAIAKCFEVSLQVRERGSQLVRGVLDELLPHTLLLLELRCELVERSRQRADLPRTGLGHTEVVLARGELRRGVSDTHDRSRHPTRQRRGEKHCGADRRRNRSQEDHGDAALEHVARRGHAGAVLDHELLELRATYSLHTDADDGERDGGDPDRCRGDVEADAEAPHGSAARYPPPLTVVT